MSRSGTGRDVRPGRRGLIGAGAVIVLLGSAAAFLSWSAFSTRRAEAGDQFLESTTTTARAADRFFESRLAALEIVAAAPEVAAGDAEAMGPALQAAVTASFGLDSGVGWVDADGVLQASTSVSAADLPLDVSDRDYVRAVLATGLAQVGDAVVGRQTGTPIVPLAVPSVRDGEVTGVVASAVPLAGIDEILAADSDALEMLHIVDGGGAVIFSHGPVDELVPVAAAGFVDEGWDLAVGLERHDDELYAVAEADTPRWTLVADDSVSVLYDDARRQFVRELLLVAALMAVAFTGSALAARRIDRSHVALVGQRNDLRVLNELTSGLATSSTAAEVAEVARRALCSAFATDSAWVALVDDDDEWLEVLAGTGLDDERRDRYRLIPLSARSGLSDAARERQRTVLDADGYAERYPATAEDFAAVGAAQVVYAPFASRGAHGAVGVGLRDRAPLDEHQEWLLDGMLRMVAEAFARARALEREMEISLTLQRALLPTTSATTVDRLQRALRYEPGGRQVEVGGDWYDLFELPDGRLAIVIGDVVGRGAAAAATMGQVRIALRSTAPLFTSAAEALEHLDRSVAHLPGTLMTTALLAILDPERQEVTMASAGHLPPILAGPDGARALVEVSGPALGIAAADRRRTETTVPLEPESTLVLYTDGLVERRGEPIDQGWERLVDDLRELWSRPVEQLADEVLDRRRLPDGHDDVALAVFRIPAQPSRTFSARFPAGTVHLASLRWRLRQWLAAHGMDGRIDDVLLGVGEAASNVVEHAYGLPGTVADLVVEAEVDGDDLLVLVGDTGRWDPRPSEASRGRGLTIMEAVADDVRIERGATGTTVHLRFATVRVGDVTPA